jgi:hypothetical protein
MTQDTAASRFEGHSLLAITAGVGAVVLVGVLCHLLPVLQPMQASLTGGAVGIPAAIDYYVQGRRRDRQEDIAHLQRDQLRRPVGPVVVMFAAALLAFEQVGMFSNLGGYGFGPVFMLATVADFFIASYASHYLGEHPYRWTAVAVICSYVAQLLLLLKGHVKIYGNVYWPGEAHLGASQVGLALGYLATLGVCLAGAWYGRRHHEKFLAKKLARLQRAAAKREPPQSRQELLELLKKLAQLRDAGVLTDKEFETKKAEILAQL